MIGKVKYIGKSFGVDGLTDNKRKLSKLTKIYKEKDTGK